MITVSGLAEATSDLNKISDHLANLPLDDPAGLIVAEARTLAPVRTGRYRDSIRTDRSSANRATVRAGGARVPYAAVIEARHHVLGQATRAATNALARALDQDIANTIRDLGAS